MSALSAHDALTTAALHRMFADETDAFDEFVANHKRLDLDYLTDCADGMCRAARRQADDVLAVLASANYEATVKADAIRELAQKQRQYAADMTTKDGKWECVQAADWLDEQADSIAAADSDPTKAAIDVIAREVTEQMLDPMDLGDLWSDYPEIGEDAWRDVVGRILDRAQAAKPDVETYKTAYAHLQGRAEAWAAENDPA